MLLFALALAEGTSTKEVKEAGGVERAGEERASGGGPRAKPRAPLLLVREWTIAEAPAAPPPSSAGSARAAGGGERPLWLLLLRGLWLWRLPAVMTLFAPMLPDEAVAAIPLSETMTVKLASDGVPLPLPPPSLFPPPPPPPPPSPPPPLFRSPRHHLRTAPPPFAIFASRLRTRSAAFGRGARPSGP